MAPAQQGTGLLELLISVTLFLFLVLIVSRFLVTMHTQGTQLQSRLNSLSTIYAAQELLKRDIRSALHIPVAWIMASGTPIWLVHGMHIQWYLSSERLVRRTGAYSRDLSQWEKYTDSVILCNVQAFLLKPHQTKNKTVDFVSYKMVTKDDMVSGCSYIQNRDSR